MPPHTVVIFFSCILHTVLPLLQSQLDLVTSVLSRVYPDGPLEVSDPEAHVSHPLNGLGMLRRMGRQLRQGREMEALFGVDGDKEEGRGGGGAAGRLEELAGRIREAAAHFPDEENHRVGVGGVVLLQEAYSLNISSLAAGEVRVGGAEEGRSFAGKFRPSWQELAELGRAAFDRGWVDSSVRWFEEALVARGEHGDGDEVSRISVQSIGLQCYT